MFESGKSHITASNLSVRSESLPADHTQVGESRCPFEGRGTEESMSIFETSASSMGCHIHSITYLFVHPSVHLSIHIICFTSAC